MTERKSLVLALLLSSATWASINGAKAQTAGKDKPANLELRLRPHDIRMGVPTAFTLVLTNVSDHDVRIPAFSVGCLNSSGLLSLEIDFLHSIRQPPGSGAVGQ